MNFLFNLSSVLAHSIVFYAREASVVELRCEDNSAPGPSTSANRLSRALENYLPSITQSYISSLLPVEQAQLDASKVISPQYYDLVTQLMLDYGPALAQAGAAQEAAARQAGTEADLALLQGSGGQLIRSAESLSRELNPEYYGTLETTGRKVNDLLGSIDLNAPNVEAERLVNQEAVRSGNAATPNATSTVSNALSFGNELQKRRDALNQAITTATNFLAPSKTSFGAQDVLNRPGSNAGTAQFQGVTQPTNAGFDIANQFLGGLTGLRSDEMNINSQNRDWIDRVNEGFNAI